MTPRLADTRTPRIIPSVTDDRGRVIVDVRLIEDLQELAHAFAAEGAADTAAALRTVGLVAYHETAAGGRPPR